MAVKAAGQAAAAAATETHQLNGRIILGASVAERDAMALHVREVLLRLLRGGGSQTYDKIFSKVTIGKVLEASYVFPKRNALIFSRRYEPKLRKNVTPRFNSHDGIKRKWEYGSRRTDF